MNVELQYLLFTAILTGVLWIPVVIDYVKTRSLLTPVNYRSAPTSELPDWVNRANRAHLNAVENFAPFAAVVLIAQLMDVSNALTVKCAAIFFFARLAHALIHLSGIGFMMARTIAFNAAWAAFMVYSILLLIRFF